MTAPQCPVDARLDWERYAAARKPAGVREQVVASALRVDPPRLRRMLRGSTDITLGQAVMIAAELRVPPVALLAAEHLADACPAPRLGVRLPCEYIALGTGVSPAPVVGLARMT